MRLRVDIRRPVSPDTRGMRDERRRQREVLRQQKEQVKRIRKLTRHPTIRPKKTEDFPDFKINGMARGEARKYGAALKEFITFEKSLEETSDDFTESEEESPKRKLVVGGNEIDKNRRDCDVRIEEIAEKRITLRMRKKRFGEDGKSVKRKRKRNEKLSKLSENAKKEDRSLEVSPEIMKKFPIKECRVVLRRLSSEIAEELVSRCWSVENVEKRRSNGRFQRSPTKSVSAGEMETTEEDDYILDESNILEIFSGNLNSSIHIYSPCHPTFSNEEVSAEDSSSPPVLDLPSQESCRENSRSPPLLYPFGMEHSEDRAESLEKDEAMAMAKYCESYPAQHSFADLVSTLGKYCRYLDIVCIDWNHSASPSEVLAEKLSDSQLEMLVTTMESSSERLRNKGSMLGEGSGDSHVPDLGWQGVHPSFQQQEINVAFQVRTRNVTCVSGDYSVQETCLEGSQDVLQFELQQT